MIYHETKHGTLYCGDSLDALKGLGNNSVDCCHAYCPLCGKKYNDTEDKPC